MNMGEEKERKISRSEEDKGSSIIEESNSKDWTGEDRYIKGNYGKNIVR